MVATTNHSSAKAKSNIRHLKNAPVRNSQQIKAFKQEGQRPSSTAVPSRQEKNKNVNSNAILVNANESPAKFTLGKKQNENIVGNTMPKRPQTTSSPIDRSVNNMHNQSIPATS